MPAESPQKPVVCSEPSGLEDLFISPRWAWLWLAMRLYVGNFWFKAGLEKLADHAWMDGGEPVKGYWQNAVKIPEAPHRPPIAYRWYRSFIQLLLDSGSHGWFAKLVAVGEALVGANLILGSFTIPSAYLGSLMNLNYMLAGSAGANPVIFTLSLLLLRARKVSGRIGVDRWLQPAIAASRIPGGLSLSRRNQNRAQALAPLQEGAEKM